MKYFFGLIFLATSVAGGFSDDFYRLLAKEHANENIVSSPFSLEIALSMVYMGARGKTAQELRKALIAPENKLEVASMYRDLSKNLKNREKVAILDIANRIYVNDKFRLVPKFNEIVKDYFQAEAASISLDNADSAASIVNSWVSQQTRDRIREIVTPMDMNPDLLIVLLNAIYFKGEWQLKFSKEDSRLSTFIMSNGGHKPAVLMSLSDSLRADYLPDLDAKVLQLPYRNSSLSMFVFLPNKIDGLSQLEDKIAGYSFKTLTEREVIVKLPQFQIEFTKELDGILKKLDIVEAFSPSANLQDLVAGKKSFISKVTQKAFIEVNEEGAEAAAVTAVFGAMVMSFRPAPPPPMYFIADHPFAFVIRDENITYFQGHFVEPDFILEEKHPDNLLLTEEGLRQEILNETNFGL